MAKYYIFIDRQYGPFEVHDLQELLAQRRFSQECWVFQKGETQDWTRAVEVPSLKSLFLSHSKSQSDAPAISSPTLKIHDKKPALETNLISGSKAEAIKALELKLPKAPLSDIPSKSKAIQALDDPNHKTGLFDRIKQMLRLS